MQEENHFTTTTIGIVWWWKFASSDFCVPLNFFENSAAAASFVVVPPLSMLSDSFWRRCDRLNWALQKTFSSVVGIKFGLAETPLTTSLQV